MFLLTSLSALQIRNSEVFRNSVFRVWNFGFSAIVTFFGCYGTATYAAFQWSSFICWLVRCRVGTVLGVFLSVLCLWLVLSRTWNVLEKTILQNFTCQLCTYWEFRFFGRLSCWQETLSVPDFYHSQDLFCLVLWLTARCAIWEGHKKSGKESFKDSTGQGWQRFVNGKVWNFALAPKEDIQRQ